MLVVLLAFADHALGPALHSFFDFKVNGKLDAFIFLTAALDRAMQCVFDDIVGNIKPEPRAPCRHWS